MASKKELNDFIDELYRKYSKELVMTAVKRIENEQDAMDIVSEVFLIATLKGNELYYHPNKIAWLYCVLEFIIKKYNVINTYRKTEMDETGEKIKKYMYIQTVPINDIINALVVDENLFEGNLFDDYKSILSKEEIKYLIYRYEYGYDNNKIANLLGKTNSATATYGNRIRNKVKKFLN